MSKCIRKEKKKRDDASDSLNEFKTSEKLQAEDLTNESIVSLVVVTHGSPAVSHHKGPLGEIARYCKLGYDVPEQTVVSLAHASKGCDGWCEAEVSGVIVQVYAGKEDY